MNYPQPPSKYIKRHVEQIRWDDAYSIGFIKFSVCVSNSLWITKRFFHISDVPLRGGQPQNLLRSNQTTFQFYFPRKSELSTTTMTFCVRAFEPVKLIIWASRRHWLLHWPNVSKSGDTVFACTRFYCLKKSTFLHEMGESFKVA